MAGIALYTDRSDEWATPNDLFNSLNDEFHFTLDPCASETNHKTELYYSKYDNGLIQDWSNQIVFCNPPYSSIKNWVYKCWYEWFYNNVTIVLLIPARTDTKYFHEYIYHQAEIRFIKGRLHFNGSKNSAPLS